MDENLFNPKRKSYVAIGNIYFWTATINDWQKLLKSIEFKTIILDSLSHLSSKGKIDVFAFVIMPNHIHLIWRINEMNGKEMPHTSFLKHTAHYFKKKLRHQNPSSLLNYMVDAENKDYEFWQRDSLAIKLYNSNIAYQKMDYLHNNPLQEHWQLAETPADYLYSSASFYENGNKYFSFLKDLRDEF
ncbi:transposase [Pedobacter sp. UC225_65]|uniref:transposase n=1 Tax=Pedobacter sp. UC225_65 TaxID=3350173 RepID=UPI0036735DC0